MRPCSTHSESPRSGIRSPVLRNPALMTRRPRAALVVGPPSADAVVVDESHAGLGVLVPRAVLPMPLREIVPVTHVGALDRLALIQLAAKVDPVRAVRRRRLVAPRDYVKREFFLVQAPLELFHAYPGADRDPPELQIAVRVVAVFAGGR